MTEQSAGRQAVRTCMIALALGVAAPVAFAQAPSTPSQMIAAQQSAIARLSGFAGTWRGSGWSLVGDRRLAVTVTQRVGNALDGTTQVIETRSFAADGSMTFHAFNNVAFNADKGEYVMQARAEGRFGNFPFRATADGYVWEIGGGGNGLRYTGSLKDGTWHETTERLVAGMPPSIIGEFTVKNISTTDWPAAGALNLR